jgi:hypothetical protein
MMQMNLEELVQHLTEDHLAFFELTEQRLMASIDNLGDAMPQYDANGDGFLSREEASGIIRDATMAGGGLGLGLRLWLSGLGPGILMHGDKVPPAYSI